MAWEIEKFTEKVKKNPAPFLVGGGGVILIIFILYLRKDSSSSFSKYPGEAALPPSPSYPSGGSDNSDLAYNLLSGFAAITEKQQENLMTLMGQQQESFMAGLSSIAQGQTLLFGKIFEQQESIFERLSKLIISQQQQQIKKTSPSGSYYDLPYHSYDYKEGTMELPGGGTVNLPSGTWSGYGISVTQAGGWEAWDAMVARDVANMIADGKLDPSVMR